MFKKIKEIIVSLVAEADARHELQTQQALSRMNAPRMTNDELKKMFNEATVYIDKVNKGEKVPEYIDPSIEQKRKDEEFIMFRKGQLKNEINESLSNVSGLKQVQFFGSIINEIREKSKEQSNLNTLKP